MAANQKRILVIHGPNLDLLGTREVDIYGASTLEDINASLITVAKREDFKIKILQSSEEGKIVEIIGKAKKDFDGIVINPAAYTHTSVAIRDAILACEVPAIEVHLSNVFQRETFRHHSYIAPVALGQISGFGPYSYILALYALLYHLDTVNVVRLNSGDKKRKKKPVIKKKKKKVV